MYLHLSHCFLLSRTDSPSSQHTCGPLTFEWAACSFHHIHRVPPGWSKPSHDGSNTEEPGSFLNTRGNWMESPMQRYLVEASMTWAKLVQVLGGLPLQRKSSPPECLPKSPVGIFNYPSQRRECFPLSRRRR